MKLRKKTTVRAVLLTLVSIGVTVGCGFDSTVHEYLYAQFWFPFAKSALNLVNRSVPRLSQPFAGMTKDTRRTPWRIFEPPTRRLLSMRHR